MQAENLKTLQIQTRLNLFFLKVFSLPKSVMFPSSLKCIRSSPLPLESCPGFSSQLWVQVQMQSPAPSHACAASGFSWALSSPSLPPVPHFPQALSLLRDLHMLSPLLKSLVAFQFCPCWLHNLKGVHCLTLLENPELFCTMTLWNQIFICLCFGGLSPLPKDRDPICLFHTA